METDSITPIVDENIKIMKMSKGYNWEIKVFINNDDDKTIARLEKINLELMQKFGSLI